MIATKKYTRNPLEQGHVLEVCEKVNDVAFATRMDSHTHWDKLLSLIFMDFVKISKMQTQFWSLSGGN